MSGCQEVAAVRRGPGSGRGAGRHRRDQDHGARGRAQGRRQQSQITRGQEVHLSECRIIFINN
jgi:hypothetical protein